MQTNIDHFNQFTAKLLTEFIKIYVPETKKLYKLKKDEKVKLISKYAYDNDIPISHFVYIKPVRELRQYGISKGIVKAYDDTEQSMFNSYYDDSLMLQQKKLDEKKHKIQYNRNLKIDIQEHQKRFILSFITDSLQGCLLFHSVGSGKTLTSVIFSHYYLAIHPTYNVCIISPPSLLFNFIEAMKEYGLDIRDNRYKFQTFNKFCKDTDKYVNEKTLLIIDEVHYFRTTIQKGGGELTDPLTGKIKIDNGMNHNGDLIIQACSKANKIICMTGTPFINKLYDIENIMSMIGKKKPITETAFDNLLIRDDNVKDYFNYRISYFNVMDTDSKKYFPSVIKKYIPITIDDEKYIKIYESVAHGSYLDTKILKNNKQDNLIRNLLIEKKKDEKTTTKNQPNNNIKKIQIDSDEEDEDIEYRGTDSLKAYYNGSRQLADFIMFKKIMYIIELVKKYPDQNIIIYSVFMAICLNLIKGELIKNNIKYVSIDGDVNIKKRQENLNKFNDIESGYNVLLISKAGTEGVSTRRTRHIVICESNFNSASIEQAIARAVRFKSHEELPKDERNVTVHRLILCVDKKDENIVANMNGEKYDNQYFEIEKNIDSKNLAMLNIVKLASKKYYNETKANVKLIEKRYFDVEYTKQHAQWKKQRSMFRKKPPFNFEWKLWILFDYVMKDILLPYKLQKSKKFIENINEYNKVKHVDETRINLEEKSISADIKLEIMALKKQMEIDNFIKRMYKSGDNNVKTIEEFDEDLTNKLLKSYNSGKSIRFIIDEQQTIIKENKKVFINVTNDIIELIENDVRRTRNSKNNREPHQVLQEYHTPLEIARELIKHSTKLNDAKLRILEPTAGFGMLIRAVVEKLKHTDYMVEMIEINPTSRVVLEAYEKTMPTNLKLQDSDNFLLYNSNENYDLIIMNPPFHLRKGENKTTKDMFDTDFVNKALTMLKDDGEILCIVSNAMIKRKNLNENIKVELLKEYKNFKWKGEKGDKLNLNFSMYRITKDINKIIKKRNGY